MAPETKIPEKLYFRIGEVSQIAGVPSYVLRFWETEFPTVKPDSGDVAHHPFVPEIGHFMECIEDDVESHASIYDMVKTMALCFAMDESAAKGGQPVAVKSLV